MGQRNGELGWVNRRGRGAVFSPVFRYRIEINRHGFRDREREVAKAPGTKRVLVLGDSVAWGWGVNNGERFSDRLEERLPGCEVLNMAVPGYGTDQSLWNLQQRGWEWHPDLVLYTAISNDVLESTQDHSYDMAKPCFRQVDGAWTIFRPEDLGHAEPMPGVRAAATDFLQRNLALAALFRPARPAIDASVQPENVSYTGTDESYRALIEQILNRLADPQEPSHHALVEMARECREHGVPFVAVAVPFEHDQHLYEPRFPAPPHDPGRQGPSMLSVALAKVGQAEGFPVWNVDRAMGAQAAAGVRLHCGDGHPNAEGHRVIADQLAPALAKRLAP
ncbi:MAG: SGNH/GDSL hydrolase family protein [Planctomycetota bacterium]